MRYRFEPIKGLWQFHLLYLVLTGIFVWGTFPSELFHSFLFLMALALTGLIAVRLTWHIISHVLAFVLGIFTPVVIFIQIAWWQVALIAFGLSVLTYIARKNLF